MARQQSFSLVDFAQMVLRLNRHNHSRICCRHSVLVVDQDVVGPEVLLYGVGAQEDYSSYQVCVQVFNYHSFELHLPVIPVKYNMNFSNCRQLCNTIS